MSITETEPRDYRIRVEEDKHGIYVTEATAEVIRAEANGQADEYMAKARALWDDCDVSNLDELEVVAFQLRLAMSCVETLIWLAPTPDDEDEGDA
jgi:hypothetical protein